MKTVILLYVVVAAVAASFEDTHDLPFDNFDVKPLLENPRTLKYYGKCPYQGPCSPEGLEFKYSIPEAMKTVCGKCTPKQRELVRVVVHAFQTKQPQIWNELVYKMDPKGEYTEAFNNFLKTND